MRSVVNSGNRITTDGLIFYLDVANSKSYISGSTTTNDLISNIDGTLENGVGYDTDNLGCFVFDGIDDYIDCTNDPIFNFEYTDSFSLSLWVKFDNVSGSKTILNKYQPSVPLVGYVLESSNSKVRFFLISGAGYLSVLSTTSLSIGTWYNLIVTYDGSNNINGLNIYINSSIDNTVVQSDIPLITSMQVPNRPLEIGRLSNNSRYVNGKVSNLSIYNKELTQSEVLQNYNALKYRFI
jgi:hypothetical protein